MGPYEAAIGFTALMALIWLMMSVFAFLVIADIKPQDRELLRPRWVRICAVVATPLFLVGLAILIVAVLVVGGYQDYARRRGVKSDLARIWRN